ncbi:MAG: hypothetical protein QM784_30290 [Polyangiaceae bacterium]
MKSGFGLVLFRRLEREEVLAIARAHAESRNWPWEEPVVVQMGLFTAHVMTNSEYRGGNVNVWISHQTGEVRKSQLVSR